MCTAVLPLDDRPLRTEGELNPPLAVGIYVVILHPSSSRGGTRTHTVIVLSDMPPAVGLPDHTFYLLLCLNQASHYSPVFEYDN